MTGVEQRHVKSLDAKKLGLNQIVAELKSVYGEHAYPTKAADDWMHQVK
jgi:hypothetical protein